MALTDKVDSESTTKVQSVRETLSDDALLAKLGYKSEFKREFSVRSSWCLSGSIALIIDEAFRDCVVRIQYHGRHCICDIHIIIRSCFW